MPSQPPAAPGSTDLPPVATGPTPGRAEDRRAQRVQNHRAFLDDALKIGANLLRLVDQEAGARFEANETARPISGEPASHLAVAYDCIMRSMRRTIALDHRLDELAQAQPARTPAQQRTDARKAIIREVEDAIHDTANEADAKTLKQEFYERLDTPDFEDDLRHRPIADIIRDIYADLGLDETDALNPSRRRTPEDLARLCARAASPARPDPGPRIDPGPGTDPPDRRSRH